LILCLAGVVLLFFLFRSWFLDLPTDVVGLCFPFVHCLTGSDKCTRCRCSFLCVCPFFLFMLSEIPSHFPRQKVRPKAFAPHFHPAERWLNLPADCHPFIFPTNLTSSPPAIPVPDALGPRTSHNFRSRPSQVPRSFPQTPAWVFPAPLTTRFFFWNLSGPSLRPKTSFRSVISARPQCRLYSRLFFFIKCAF